MPPLIAARTPPIAPLRSEPSAERGGFLIIVYFVIALAGYIVGAYARYHHEKFKVKAAAPAQSISKK